MRPSRTTARTVGATLMLVVALAHLLMLPEGFRLGAYVGVWMILALGLALAGVGALVLQGQRPAWWFVFVIAAINAVGYLISRATGLPAVSADTTGHWNHPEALLLFYASALLTGLSAWALLTTRPPPPGRLDAHRLPEQEHRSGQNGRRRAESGQSGGGRCQP